MNKVTKKLFYQEVFIMLGLNQMKKVIYLAVFLVGLSFSSLAWGNAEISAHFGMKFGSKLNLQEITTSNLWPDQTNQSFHLGADVLYRHMMGDTGSFGVGARYRFAFTGSRDFEGIAQAAADQKYQFNHHRVALLLNYRFHMDQFFIGPVVGLDIWKSLSFSWTPGANERPSGDDPDTYFRSNQFLWDQITGQLGLELGYKPTDNLLVKLEAGYDLSSFGDLKCETPNQNEETCTNGNTLVREGTGEDADTEKLKLDAFYVTLGIGWFFG